MIPVITILGIVFGFLMAGNAVVESVFAWPGIGNYAVTALMTKDSGPIQSFVLFVAAACMSSSIFVVDLVYGLDRSAHPAGADVRRLPLAPPAAPASAAAVRWSGGGSAATRLSFAALCVIVADGAGRRCSRRWSRPTSPTRPTPTRRWQRRPGITGSAPTSMAATCSRASSTPRGSISPWPSAPPPLALAIGCSVGVVAGLYRGGWVDNVDHALRRFRHGLPGLHARDGASPRRWATASANVLIAIAITQIPTYLRLIRGEMLPRPRNGVCRRGARRRQSGLAHHVHPPAAELPAADDRAGDAGHGLRAAHHGGAVLHRSRHPAAAKRMGRR